jgi:hypothetical protein
MSDVALYFFQWLTDGICVGKHWPDSTTHDLFIHGTHNFHAAIRNSRTLPLRNVHPQVPLSKRG